jgi:hypothetical protein
MAMNAIAIGSLKGASDGRADVTAIAPAVTLTATVNTYEIWIAAPAVKPGIRPRFCRATM